jgi:hypothetical protein
LQFFRIRGFGFNAGAFGLGNVGDGAFYKDFFFNDLRLGSHLGTTEKRKAN